MERAREVEAKVDWSRIREQFNLDRDYVQLGASQFLASHPRAVREAIENYAQQLDVSPVLYTEESENKLMQNVREEVASYFGVANPDDIAMTDSTTMGLGTVYTALDLKPRHEVLTTDHDHYSHHESIRRATTRTGAKRRRITLYENLSAVSVEEILENAQKGILDETRVLGITWVHSSSGLKLPIPEIAAVVRKINAGRPADEKVLLVVDGVHGFGIELENFSDLGCDFFITGCHKWLYGPRGTGFIAATREAWQAVTPIIPSFTETMDLAIEESGRPAYMDGKQMTPGGFHSLEYRWALADAFRFIHSIGKENIYQRVHQLNRYCKEGLSAIRHVTLHTPIADSLSAGIIAFEVDGFSTPEVVKALLEKKVVATAAPYKTSWARFTPGILNSFEEIDLALEAVNSLRR